MTVYTNARLRTFPERNLRHSVLTRFSSSLPNLLSFSGWFEL